MKAKLLRVTVTDVVAPIAPPAPPVALFRNVLWSTVTVAALIAPPTLPVGSTPFSIVTPLTVID